MSLSERIRPTRAALVVGAVLGTAVLTGCGSGLITQTSEQVAAVGGYNATSGQVAVRDAVIVFGGSVEGGSVYRRGADAPLNMSIINTGPAPDRLVSASSPVAAAVEITGATELPGGQVLLVDGEPAAQAPATTSSATPRPTPTATPAAAPGENSRETQIVLTGLRDDIRAGLTYPVVLVFERAGEIRMDVPVGGTDEPREVLPHDIEPAG